MNQRGSPWTTTTTTTSIVCGPRSRRREDAFQCPLILWYRVAGGAFWLLRRTFLELGGFDETRLSFEDVEFARRLKAHGRKQGKRFKILLAAHIVTSSRKFDIFGDWYFLLRPWIFLRFFRGADQATADRYWYRVRRDPGGSREDRTG